MYHTKPQIKDHLVCRLVVQYLQTNLLEPIKEGLDEVRFAIANGCDCLDIQLSGMAVANFLNFLGHLSLILIIISAQS